jgi:hypothetical protein
MTTTEVEELVRQAHALLKIKESVEVEQVVKFLEDQLVEIFGHKKVFGPDELPPKSFTEFLANLHEVDSGKSLPAVVTEVLASRLSQYGTKITKKRTMMALEPVYRAVRDEWLNRHVLV